MEKLSFKERILDVNHGAVFNLFWSKLCIALTVTRETVKLLIIKWRRSSQWRHLNRTINLFGFRNDPFLTNIRILYPFESTRKPMVGNKTKGRISKQVFQENQARQIFRKTNISYPLIHLGVRNVRFSEIWRAFFFLKHPFLSLTFLAYYQPLVFSCFQKDIKCEYWSETGHSWIETSLWSCLSAFVGYYVLPKSR